MDLVLAAINPQVAQEFWNWFRQFSSTLITNHDNPAVIRGLDAQIAILDPSLSWELGPGISKPWRFVISPDLHHKIRDKARAIVALAPELPDWEFCASRQPKTWDYRFTLKTSQNMEPMTIDASEWQFVLLRYADGKHEVLIEGRGLSNLTEDERWNAAAVLLESILGEDTLLDHIDSFDLVEKLELSLAAKAKPIRNLREVFASVVR